MSRKVKGPDGVVRIFPDDATDAEISAALEPAQSSPTLGAHPEAKISAGRGGEYFSGLPPAPDLNARRDANMIDVGGVGIAPEDALSVGPTLRLVGSAARGVAGLASRATPSSLMSAVRVLGPLAYGNVKPALKAAARVMLEEIEKHGSAVATQAAPAAAETAAPVVAGKVASRVAPAVVEAAAPVAAKAAVFNPNDALKAAKEAFTALGETPLRAEVSNSAALMARGKSPEDAVRIVLSNRPKSVDPAELFNAKFGTLNDEQARAALDLRNARGQIKTPSAETAASRRAGAKVVAPPAQPWTPESGGELFHGTTDQRLGQFGQQKAIYMTTDAAEAQGYARGVHAPGQARGKPIVSKVSAKPGKTVDISDKIMDAMTDDTFDHDWLDAAMDEARKSGARYVTYEHPSNLPGDQMQRVIVALHPKADLLLTSPRVR